MCVQNHEFMYNVCCENMAKRIKKTRIDLRVTKEDKVFLMEAASYNGMSLSKYIIEAAIIQAYKDLRKADNVSLSDEGSKRLAELLTNPPKTTKHLKELLK